jgi:hypothetical protein
MNSPFEKEYFDFGINIDSAIASIPAQVVVCFENRLHWTTINHDSQRAKHPSPQSPLQGIFLHCQPIANFHGMLFYERNIIDRPAMNVNAKSPP